MSKEVKLRDVLTPQESKKIEELKETMKKAPNKAEVHGIAEEVYEIYEKVQRKHSGN
ncbi:MULTISPECIES: hypothetical protein [Bacillaceae]|uniref:hypothetical protein n=1 Tax=Bacillaceae TaxID=186817 RepID=UPI002A127FA5|nr:hypothetical protein [Cytobacillus sp. IB215316]MDX8362978.1 hypothetical protein [Cytobacillus sp. IB215316]